MVNLTYGQETLTEKGGTEAKRPVIWAAKINNTSLLNLYKVDNDIFRCEQPDEKGFQELTDMGVKSVLNLRNKHTDSMFLQKVPLNYFKVNMEAKDISDDEIIEALKILKEAPKPIVVHCKHGADRTGAVIAMYRIIFQNWTKEKAIAELKYGGFGFHVQLENIPIYVHKANIEEIKKMVLGN
jgi:protein tyrosine phosphatase (PTP) superfamily phosphohydrolase (DUF442 family)